MRFWKSRTTITLQPEQRVSQIDLVVYCFQLTNYACIIVTHTVCCYIIPVDFFYLLIFFRGVFPSERQYFLLHRPLNMKHAFCYIDWQNKNWQLTCESCRFVRIIETVGMTLSRSLLSIFCPFAWNKRARRVYVNLLPVVTLMVVSHVGGLIFSVYVILHRGLGFREGFCRCKIWSYFTSFHRKMFYIMWRVGLKKLKY